MIHLLAADGVMMLSLQTVAGLSSAATSRARNEDFTITEKAPTWVFFWLKAPTIKTLC